MLFVDSRTGSKELIKPLAKLLSLNPDDMETTLDFGDIAFTGRGPADTPIDIGVEFKKVSDIAQCCRDGRFSGHQLPGMRKTYNYSWLVIEGTWRHDDAGFVTTYQGPRRGWAPIPGKMRAAEFEKHILTFELLGGVRVRYTNTRADSLRAIVDLYRWWTDKPMDAHTSHLMMHQPAGLANMTDERRVFAALPGIGQKLSGVVEKHFKGSIYWAVNAPAATWAEIDGIGIQKAHTIVQFLRR